MGTDLSFVEFDDGAYLRTDNLFAALEEDLHFYISEGDKEVEAYILSLAARLREAIMKRENV